MRRNHQLTIATRRVLCERLPVRPTCPEEMLGSMAAFLLPDCDSTIISDADAPSPSPRLGRLLLEQFGIEVPVYYWTGTRQAILRISVQAYNGLEQYVRVAEVLKTLFRSA
jgi:isopenicillin-N epimerase